MALSVEGARLVVGRARSIDSHDTPATRQVQLQTQPDKTAENDQIDSGISRSAGLRPRSRHRAGYDRRKTNRSKLHAMEIRCATC